MKKCLVALSAALLVAGCGGKPHPAPATPQSATGSVHPAGWATVGPPPTASLSLSSSQTVSMFDTTTVSTVPHHPFADAGYTAGFWPTFFSLRRAFPSAHTVSIAIAAGYRADCLDVELGDATPSEVPGWVWAEKRSGWKRPCVYSDWSEWTSQIRPVLKRAHIHRWEVWEWDAFYDYRPHIDPGFDGTQWTDKAFGRNLDESLILRSFLSIAHPPLSPAPSPKPKPYPKPKPKPHPKPHRPTRLQRLETERNRLRQVLIAQHCRVKHPNAHCRGVLRRGVRLNRAIHHLGGR